MANGSNMTPRIRDQWEGAAHGWARWEPTIVDWMREPTEVMLEMAGARPGSRLLDLACGAGSQTLLAAQRVGPDGEVIASDIAENMLEHVREHASAERLSNVTTLAGPAEELNLPAGSLDAVICRLGLMLFADPGSALRAVRKALKPGGRIAAVVFTVPEHNPFMSRPMQILLRHAGKNPPGPGKPGIFALGAPGVFEKLLLDSGFSNVEQRIVPVTMRHSSAEEALQMMQDAFGAYRAVIADSPEDVQAAAWGEVLDALRAFETKDGFAAPAEVLVAAATANSG